MDARKQGNGIETFLEHWWVWITILVAIITERILGFFMGLSGIPWICFFVASCALMVVGASLIVYAKLPVYRSGRFLTFGLKAVPHHLVRVYCWGWRIFLFGAVLGLCLLLSRP
jgi:hypothetical protein